MRTRPVREWSPTVRGLFARGQTSLIGGVPMPWMMRWAGGFPPFAARDAVSDLLGGPGS